MKISLSSFDEQWKDGGSSSVPQKFRLQVSRQRKLEKDFCGQEVLFSRPSLSQTSNKKGRV